MRRTIGVTALVVAVFMAIDAFSGVMNMYHDTPFLGFTFKKWEYRSSGSPHGGKKSNRNRSGRIKEITYISGGFGYALSNRGDLVVVKELFWGLAIIK